MSTIESRWAIVVQVDDGARYVSAVWGPYAKDEARQTAMQWNEEWDGSPYSAVVRPMTKINGIWKV